MTDRNSDDASEAARPSFPIGPYEAWMVTQGLLYRRNQPAADDRALVGIAVFPEQATPLPGPVGIGLKDETGYADDLPDKAKVMTSVFSSTDRFGAGLRYMPVTLVGDPEEMRDNPSTLVSSSAFLALTSSFALPTKDFMRKFSIENVDFSEAITSEEQLLTNGTKSAARAFAGRSASGKSVALTLNYPIPPSRINHSFSPTSGPRQLASSKKPLGEHDGPLVIVGVIDDGLPFAHENYCGTNKKTRIDYCWLQGSDALGVNDAVAVAFGKELTGQAIDGLIAKWDGDEDAIYADPESGAVTSDPDTARNIFQSFTHGAHIMDRACGFQPSDAGYNQRDAVRVIGVQLPRTSLEDTSGFGKDAYILAGVHYILDRAERIAAKVDSTDAVVLINISLGTTGGPKNGRSLIEKAIDEVTLKYSSDIPGGYASCFSKVKVFLPTGNNYDSQMAATAVLSAQNPKATVEWHIQPNDRTPNFVEFWFDCGEENFVRVGEAISMTVTPPAGEDFAWSVPPIDERSAVWSVQPVMKNGKQIGQISLDHSAGRYRFLFILAPTEFETADKSKSVPLASAGIWTLGFTLNDPALFADNLTLDGVIQRDEDPAGTGTGGRQSYFGTTPGAREADVYRTHDREGRRIADEAHEPSKSRFSISGYRTINGWATHETASTAESSARVSVAGFTAQRNLKGEIEVEEAATYSSAGAKKGKNDKEPPFPAVQTSAISNRSVVFPGVVGAGTRSGSNQILVGTSAAAPALLRNEIFAALGLPQGKHGQETGREVRLGKEFLISRGADPNQLHLHTSPGIGRQNLI